MKTNYANCFCSCMEQLLNDKNTNLKNYEYFFLCGGANYSYSPDKYEENVGKFNYEIQDIINNCNNKWMTARKIEKEEFIVNSEAFNNILLYVKTDNLQYDPLFKHSIPKHHWIIYKKNVGKEAVIEDVCIILDAKHKKNFIGKICVSEIYSSMIYGIEVKLKGFPINKDDVILECFRNSLLFYVEGQGRKEFDEYLDNIQALSLVEGGDFTNKCLYVGYSLVYVCYVQLVVNAKCYIEDTIHSKTKLWSDILNEIEELYNGWIKCRLFIQKIGVENNKEKLSRFFELLKQTKKKQDIILRKLIHIV